MKKTIYTSLLVAGIMLAGTTVNAQVVSSQNAAGKTITLPEGTTNGGSGPGMTFDPSPNNIMVVSSDKSAYAITGMNTAAKNGDRMEYGFWSGMNGYYQMVNPDSAAATPVVGDLSVSLKNTTPLTTTPFTTGWVSMGGGGS